MRAYLVVFLVTLLIQLIPIYNNKGYRWRTFFSFIPLFLFGALRIDFGLDYPSYEDTFYASHYWVNLKDVSDHAEIGYVFLNSIIPTWRFFLIITSAFTCFSYGLLFYKCIPVQKSWLAICLLFLGGDKAIFFMFSGLRNAIAISIMLLSFVLIRERKWLLYSIITIIAMQFHTSAILFMPLAFLLGNGNPMQKREAIIWISVMLFLQAISLESIFNNVAEFINNYMDRYSVYAETAEEIGDNRTLLVRFSIFIFVLGMVWFMHTTELTNNENTICRLALIYMMSGLLGALSMRMYQCFIFPLVCGVVILVNKWKIRLVSYGFLLFCLLYLGYAFFVVFMQSERFPYEIYYSIIGDF